MSQHSASRLVLGVFTQHFVDKAIDQVGFTGFDSPLGNLEEFRSVFVSQLVPFVKPFSFKLFARFRVWLPQRWQKYVLPTGISMTPTARDLCRLLQTQRFAAQGELPEFFSKNFL